MGEILLQKHILETVFHQILTDDQSMTFRTFHMFFPMLVIYVTLSQYFWNDRKIFRMKIQNASAKPSISYKEGSDQNCVIYTLAPIRVVPTQDRGLLW